MSLELINTFGTVTTVVIVAAAAVAALVQLRHLRAGNQINAMLSIGDKFQGHEYTEAGDIVARNFATVVEDPAFREFAVAYGRGVASGHIAPEYVAVRRAAIFVGNTLEELGILVKNNIVDRTLFLDRYCSVIARTWAQLENFTAFTREAQNDVGIWENFEYITVLSQDWMEKHPTTYPKSVRRLQLHNPWPVPPLLASV